MKASLIRIGNSQGVRIPSAVIKQCGFEDELEIQVKNKTMQVTAAIPTRGGWEALSQIENDKQSFDEKGEWEW